MRSVRPPPGYKPQTGSKVLLKLEAELAQDKAAGQLGDGEIPSFEESTAELEAELEAELAEPETDKRPTTCPCEGLSDPVRRSFHRGFHWYRWHGGKRMTPGHEGRAAFITPNINTTLEAGPRTFSTSLAQPGLHQVIRGPLISSSQIISCLPNVGMPFLKSNNKPAYLPPACLPGPKSTIPPISLPDLQRRWRLDRGEL